MDDPKLLNLLKQLQEEIQHTDAIDAEAKDMLQELDADVHELLKRAGNGPILLHPTMAERFENTIDLLEVTHPAITRYLTEVLEILGNAGI